MQYQVGKFEYWRKELLIVAPGRGAFRFVQTGAQNVDE